MQRALWQQSSLPQAFELQPEREREKVVRGTLRSELVSAGVGRSGPRGSKSLWGFIVHLVSFARVFPRYPIQGRVTLPITHTHFAGRPVPFEIGEEGAVDPGLTP